MHNYDKWLESGAHENEDQETFLSDRTVELLNNEYNPYDPDNIYYALAEDSTFKTDDLQTMADYMAQRKHAELGLLIKCRIIEFWEKKAENHAYEDWEAGYRD